MQSNMYKTQLNNNVLRPFGCTVASGAHVYPECFSLQERMFYQRLQYTHAQHGQRSSIVWQQGTVFPGYEWHFQHLISLSKIQVCKSDLMLQGVYSKKNSVKFILCINSTSLLGMTAIAHTHLHFQPIFCETAQIYV